MHAIKRFDLKSVALYSFLLCFIFMLIFFGLFISTFGAMFSAIPALMKGSDAPTNINNPALFSGIGFVMMIVLSLIYSVFISLVNVIIALIYNLLSKKFDGIKVEVIEIKEKITSEK